LSVKDGDLYVKVEADVDAFFVIIVASCDDRRNIREVGVHHFAKDGA
jgi:hypothetical protein